MKYILKRSKKGKPFCPVCPNTVMEEGPKLVTWCYTCPKCDKTYDIREFELEKINETH